MSSPADVKAKLPKRVADYFVVVGFGSQPPAPAGGGEESRGRGRTVKGLGPPLIFDRYPREDWKDAEFPKKVAMFCFPTPIMSYSQTKVEPDCFSFAMTDSDGTRLFGAAYVIWEELSSKMFSPRALCLISHWPFCNQFQRFLSQIYRGMSSGLKYPLERLIGNFVCEVPLPPEGKVIVRYRSLPQPLEFCRPPPNKPPLRDFELNTLFEYLSVDNVLSLFSAVMCERSILFTSSKYQTLMNACQVSTYLLCPFFWRHIYIPVLPLAMADVVCAPMPFMVGMLEKDRPDPHMLNGVVIIDLDKNTIMTLGDSATIPPLPQGRFQDLMKKLKKMAGDTTVPMKAGAQNLESASIETLFLKFHARLFKNYRDFLEAPSDYVIDRFDKNRFVAQHPEKGTFLTEFMLTQMFQCFVDERYELTAAQSRVKARNLEILFFDEFIDKVHKKNSSFLADTSLAHSTEPYNVLLPETGRLPASSSSNFQYSSFPSQLDASLFATPRDVAPLVTDDDLSSGRGDMSKISMKFFTEKRMYSQHFHALRVRSSKQDVAFIEMVRFFKSAQLLDEQQIAQSASMCQATISKESIDTQSSIDAPWSSLKAFVNNQTTQEADAFRMMREEVCTPLYACTAEAGHLLEIRFAEAGKLEAKASIGKTEVERAKAVRDVLVRKWVDLKAQYKDALLSPGDIAKLVAAHNEVEVAIMTLELLEVDFQNIVNEYEARMPDIITTIRGLNAKRINAFKTAATAWCIAQRVQLHSSLSHLDELEKEVQQIDASKDLKSFMTGTIDFWAKGRRTSVAILEMMGSEGAPPPPPPPEVKLVKEDLLDQTKSAHLRRFTMAGGGQKPEKESTLGLPKCYPICLWGGEGYSLAEEQTRFTIETVEELASLFEEWSKVQDLACTKFNALLRASPPLAITDSRARMWVAMKSRVESRAKNHGAFSRQLAKLASELQLTKSQMRMMLKRFADHRARLDKDLAEKNDEKLKAYQKQQVAKKAAELEGKDPPNPSLSVMELEKRTARVEQVNKALNEAEAVYAMADRAREAVKVRQDVCLGRMLNSLEEKEKETGTQLQAGLMFVMEQCSRYCVTSLIDGDEQLESRVKQIDYLADLREVIMACYDKNVPQHERLKENEPIDLGTNLGWSRFHVAVDAFNRTNNITKVVCTFVTELSQLTELFGKALRKLPFEMKTCTAPSLGRAFQELFKMSKELCDNLEQEVKNLRDVTKILTKHQDNIRVNLKGHQKAYTEMDMAYTKAIKEQSKTEKDVQEAEVAMKAAEVKLAKARERKETGTNDLLIKAGYAKQNYENLREVQLKKADEHLVHAAKFRSLAVAGLLRQMQEEEETRCKVQVGTLNNMVDFHKRRVYKFDKVLEAFFTKIAAVDVDADLIDFLTSRKPTESPNPPDVVIADVKFRIATAPPKVPVVCVKPSALVHRPSQSTPRADGSRESKEGDEDSLTRMDLPKGSSLSSSRFSLEVDGDTEVRPPGSPGAPT